jgi:rfaE bifunctional protein nucleotidyltransferase chain/domain
MPFNILGLHTIETRFSEVERRPAALSPARPAAKLKPVGCLFSRAELIEQRRRWKLAGKTVVFTNGCYDLLHPGHIRLLEQGRSMGDVLILALNSDESVRRMKGPSRPLLDEQERAEVALALEAVDAVTLFDEETPRELIAEVLPDVLVKGADWSHFIAGREEVEAAGGKVVAAPLESGYSTTNIVQTTLARRT